MVTTVLKATVTCIQSHSTFVPQIMEFISNFLLRTVVLPQVFYKIRAFLLQILSRRAASDPPAAAGKTFVEFLFLCENLTLIPDNTANVDTLDLALGRVVKSPVFPRPQSMDDVFQSNMQINKFTKRLCAAYNNSDKNLHHISSNVTICQNQVKYFVMRFDTLVRNNLYF